MRNLGSFGGRRGALWLVNLLLLVPSGVFAVQTTSVQGIIYRADGTVAQGTMLVSWPAFTAADGSTIAAGSKTATIAPDGNVNLVLAPNGGANPAGTYYTVVYHLSDGTVEKEYWIVPQAPTATISEMRARVVPAAVAQQTVSQQYVDASISALSGSYLQLKGGTMSGSLNLAGDPAGPMQAATKEYVDAHAGGAQLPASQNVIAGRGDGGAVSMMEKGTTVVGSNAMVAWDEDRGMGEYDVRNSKYGSLSTNASSAFQAVSNRMACDVAMGVVQQATIHLPPGTFSIDELTMAPGTSWIGAPQTMGGTKFVSKYNGRWIAHMPSSMTLTCSDGQSHTLSAGAGLISHINFQGCGTGGCTNAPGDTTAYQFGGPGNTGIEQSSPSGRIEYVDAEAFGSYGIRVDGMDARGEHLRGGSNSGNLAYFVFGAYKGVSEGTATAEFSGTVASGTSGSVALTWTATPSATGYVVYRGSRSGGENTWYLTSTNSFTDTGAAGGNGGTATAQITNSLAAPTTPVATGSTTGGTLAAGTYYYIVTPTQADGWHATMELVALDGMYDWIEPYGFINGPNVYNYHHLANIELAGGTVTLSHPFPQWGQVGINIGPNGGNNETIVDPRVDFANLEGINGLDGNITVIGGVIGSSCMASNSVTLGGGTCDQLVMHSTGNVIDGTRFTTYAAFGANYATGDYSVFDGKVEPAQVSVGAELYGGKSRGVGQGRAFAGSIFWPHTTVPQNVTGPLPNVEGLNSIVPIDTTPTTYTGFGHMMFGQELYVEGGNSNVTLHNNQFLRTCTGGDINLGNFGNQSLLFVGTQFSGNGINFPVTVFQVCGTNPTTASSETVTFSATPTFSVATRASIITLSANITSFTLGAGSDGQEKTLTFCQNATGGHSVTAPTNVHGFMTVGTTANMCSSQHFTYSAAKAAWLADSPGVANE